MLTRSRLSMLIFTVVLSAPTQAETLNIKILGLNDFHGQISKGRVVKNEPVGGAPVLAAYLKQAQAGMENRTIITISGDQVGASTPASGLLHDEPAILFTNSLGNEYCSPAAPMNPLCNIVATVGNHEFDKGQKAMMDLIYGTNSPPTDAWIPLQYYPGASYPYVSANIVDAQTEKPLFPPYVIKSVQGIPIAFIGVVTKNAADSMFPSNAEGVKFLDEASAINHYVPEMRAAGAQIIIAIMHEGGNQISYEGETRNNTRVEGSIVHIVDQLDDHIDVVMGGHTHQFLNAYLPNHNGVKILVTQANSYSMAFAEVNLQIDSKTHQVKNKSAKIITTYANRGPGTTPDEAAQKIVRYAEEKVDPIINAQVGTTANPITRKQNEDGESTLGNFTADAFRAELQTDIGISNLHGLRDDIKAGIITWGNVYSVLPFSNQIVNVSLTGQDLFDLFEQQWAAGYPNILQVSGINVSYDPRKPEGQRIIDIQFQGKTLDKEQRYTIATSDFIASGGGNFSVMKKSKLIQVGDADYNTLTHYIKTLPSPVMVSIEGRIKKFER
ncbi:MAG: bifunctional metallophosphatase/5'-nucleotidase [Legionella sp.]|nr:MAG: bifunctional metallophosphatase/5'-nucleotidase [Legionella sp.]